MTRKRFSKRDLDARLAHFKGKCQMCFCEINGTSGLEWDHVIPIKLGGDDALDNLQPLCIRDHRLKTKGDVTRIAKTVRVRQKHTGIRSTKGRPIPGSKASGFKKHFDGTVSRREP